MTPDLIGQQSLLIQAYIEEALTIGGPDQIGSTVLDDLRQPVTTG